MTGEIRAIKKRKEYNRSRRKAKSPIEEEMYEKKYKEAKMKAQDMIRESMYIHEENLTRESKKQKILDESYGK